MYGETWSDDEYEILKANWEGHGRDWIGWESLLPGRTPRAIQRKANGFGLVEPKKPRNKKKEERREPRMPKFGNVRHGADPNERYVMACMRAGMTPTDIDKKMHWFPGTARLIISDKWERDKAHGQRGNREGA